MAHAQSRPLAYDITASRQPVNLSLNSDLLSRVKVFTPNLSATVETLLGEYLETVSQRQHAELRKLDGVIDAVKLLHEQSGFLSDEFSTL